jgi:hypothetical protein
MTDDGGTVGGTHATNPDLQIVIEAWQHLSNSTRQNLLTTVKNEIGKKQASKNEI